MGEKLTDKDIAGIWRRSLFLQASHNYERFQSLGYLYAMVPVLRKAYSGRPKEELSRAMHRHLEFFNTCPVVVQPILGITAAMEEQQGDEAAQAVSGIKIAMMGPLAGIGDSVMYMSVLLVCLLLAVTFGVEGNPVGLALCFLLWNGISQPLKYFGTRFGYKQGVKLVETIRTSDLISRFSFMAGVVGLTMVGGIIVQLVNIRVGLDVVEAGETLFSLQGLLDGILPGMLPLGLSLLCFALLRKKVKPVRILLGVLAAAVLGSLAGVFVLPG